MPIQRKSKFGFPPQPAQGSVTTVRAVPLTTGVQLDQPWPIQGPGSASTMCNFLPLDGVLVPRSRLSSVNTISAFPAIGALAGLAALPRADLNPTTLWVSDSTLHALVTSNGSISRASFVSSFGLGAGSLSNKVGWTYAHTFVGTLGSVGENVLLAVANSHDTVLAIYQTSGSVTGVPLYSYLTSAPKAVAIGTFDSYVIAFNVKSGSVFCPTRVQWCVRGSPSNWTSEGSGFEDLLAARGVGTAVAATADQRFLLFTDLETWYGTGAAYPSQFQFYPLDLEIGCPWPRTIAHTEFGLVFVGSDGNLRLIQPGLRSQVIVPSLSKAMRRLDLQAPDLTWGVYDYRTKVYHLHLRRENASIAHLLIHMASGTWGYAEFPGILALTAGVVGQWDAGTWPKTEAVFFASSSGTVLSTRSDLGTEVGSVVTATWRSAPLGDDLAGNYKQITQVDVDYVATSKSTIALKVSQDGGNNFESAGRTLSLASAPFSGRATSQMYIGGAFPVIEIASASTGYELHRLDVTMDIGGRK